MYISKEGHDWESNARMMVWVNKTKRESVYECVCVDAEGTNLGRNAEKRIRRV